MPRAKNLSPGIKFEVTLAAQSIDMLRDLASLGIYGRTPAEVGGRFIELSLQRFTEPPRLVPSKVVSDPEGANV
jgi:hypothetical protein